MKRSIAALLLVATMFATAGPARASSTSRVYVINHSDKDLWVMTYTKPSGIKTLVAEWCVRSGIGGGGTANAEITQVRIQIATAGCAASPILFDRTYDITSHDIVNNNVTFEGNVRVIGDEYIFSR